MSSRGWRAAGCWRRPWIPPRGTCGEKWGGLPGMDAEAGQTRRPGRGMRRQRLFAGVAELLAGVADRSPSGVGLVVEDVHWADGETLDFLTFLVRAGRRGPVRVVVTCRGDEAPLAECGGVAVACAGRHGDRGDPAGAAVAGGGGRAGRGAGGRAGVTRVIDYLYARAEGNAFFTEGGLVAAALAGQAGAGGGGGLRVPAGLPVPAGGAAGGAGGALRRGRPGGAGGPGGRRPDLGEDLLAAVTGLEAGTVRRGLRGLAAARLLAEDASGPGAPAAARAAGRGGGRRAAARGAGGAA